MTERKTFKRRVRARMAETGERYTTARRHVAAPEPEPVMPVPDEAVARETGRTWAEWLAILDAWGAAERSHTEIARYVHGEHGPAPRASTGRTGARA
jgi:hypothetical protein